MPFALYVDIIPEGGGKISAGHVFYGETEDEARENFDAHAKGDRFLAAAIAADCVDEELEEIDEDDWPDHDAEETEEEADEEPDEEDA